MESIAAGKPLIALIAHAWSADLALLLHGKHGVGKSAIVGLAANELGIEIVKLDLSLLEAPDLVGIPFIKDGRTEFAPPALLPGPGTRGILMIEEINRAPRYMQAPCLELLTERRLHSYQLPPGWVPCGAISPAGDGYFADELDPALLSRFLNVTVEPDVTEWIAWASQAGVHSKVVGFVQASSDVFNDPAANPRAWESCSKFLIEWEKRNHGANRDEQLLLKALAGYVGSKWAVAFHRIYTGQVRVLEATEIVQDYPAHRYVLREWVRHCRLDMVESSAKQLQRHLQAQRVYEAVASHPSIKPTSKVSGETCPPNSSGRCAHGSRIAASTSCACQTARGTSNERLARSR